jgi:exonuclease III
LFKVKDVNISPTECNVSFNWLYDRNIAIKLEAEPINILMIQVYKPTSEHEDDEVEELYGEIEEILEEGRKGNTNTIIMGDWNSVVGDEPYRNIVRPHGLGK